MSEPKGPSLDIPDELREELEQSAKATPAQKGDDADVEAELTATHPEGGPDATAAGDPAEVVALRAEVEELKDRRLREAAEYQNQRRRLLKEQQDALNFANENLIKELLETVDNLERALGHARPSEDQGGVDQENLQQGVELTLRSLMNMLERNGVAEVATTGQFDPRHHEAMLQVPTPDSPPGEVVQVFQKGFVLKGRLLRAAKVAVASEPPKTED